MSVQEIELAIRQLSTAERSELMTRITALDDDEWDKQMESDLKAGRLDQWLAEARSEHDRGLAKPLE